MIYLYSGTPGSGKSLHASSVIYYTLFSNKPVISTYGVRTEYVKHPEKFLYVPEEKLTPAFLMRYSQEYFTGRSVKEGEITLVIDEAQRLFNAREWDKKNRSGWNKFFQLHRHFGYDIILIAQFDRMIDRQIRSLIEYEVIHRKVSNFGLKGKIISLLMFSPHLFVAIKMWYPMKERIGSSFFRASKKFGRLYDTHMLFDELDDGQIRPKLTSSSPPAVSGVEQSGSGAPDRDTPGADGGASVVLFNSGNA